MSDDARYSPAEAAARMGVSTATVRRLMASRELAYHRVRRRIVIREEAIREYEWQSEKTATAGLSSSCFGVSGPSDASPQDAPRPTAKPSKASSEVKSLMRLISGGSLTRLSKE